MIMNVYSLSDNNMLGSILHFFVCYLPLLARNTIAIHKTALLTVNNQMPPPKKYNLTKTYIICLK